MFKVNNKDTCSGVFILNFERTYFTPWSSVFIVNFEHIIAFWVNKEKRMQCFQNFIHLKILNLFGMDVDRCKIILTEKKKQKEKLLHKNDEITQTFKEYFSTIVDKPNLYEWSL